MFFQRSILGARGVLRVQGVQGDADADSSSARRSRNGVASVVVTQTPRKPIPSPANQDDGGPGSGAGKENQSCRNSRVSPSQKVAKSRVPAAAPEKRRAAPAQTISAAPEHKRIADSAASNNNSGNVSQDESSAANRLSEELLSCLLTIFSQMGAPAPASGQDEEQQQPLSASVLGSSSEDAYPHDPYGVLELGGRDVGPNRRLQVVDAPSFDRHALAGNGNTLLARSGMCSADAPSSTIPRRILKVNAGRRG